MVKYLLVSAILACFFVLATSTGAYRPRNGLGPHRRLYPRRTPRRTFQCNKNEVWSTCTAAACRPKTCKEVGFTIPCVDLARNGTCPSGPGCICKENYARNSKDVCVPIEFCPSCGGDFNAKPGCGNCNPLCTNYDRDDVVCTEECRYNACDCKEGYVLDETCNKCVEPSQCPPRIKCNRNEVYEVCPSNCPPRTCGINDAAVSCAVSLPFGDPKCPPPTCRCKNGYYRNHIGLCVLWENCPKCRRPNEVYDPCPSTCPPERCDVDPALVLCQVQPSLGDAACKPACRCADGFRRNQTGICIPEEQCPKCLKPYQVFDPCLSCPPKRCDVDERVIRCAAPLKVGDPRCESGCRCIDGYKMNSDGDCIPENQCPPRCDFNEVYSDCIPNDCKPKTCSQLGTKIKCPIQAAVCRQGCICKEGHVRNEDEVCVPIEQCPPKCNLNEVYSDCIPNDCKPKSCSQIGTDFECPIQAAVCRQGCICKEGHVRDDDGKCVPIEKCTPQCPAYEEYSDCIQNDCFPQNCTQLGFPLDCPEVEASYCKEGCICVDGYVRDSRGKCIPIEKCPSCGGDTNKESGCGVYCNQRCSDLGKPPGACIDVCYENACTCRKGFYLDERSGNCVPPEQCPRKCPANEEYSDCIQNKCEAQNCTQLGFPIDCRQVEAAVCKQGCVCKSGYLRDHKGYCIPKEKCPSCRGDRNQVAGCGVYCNQRCRDIGKKPNFCIQVCYENACSCRKGLYLDENSGFCVKAEECSPQCPTNEVYSTCIQGQCSPQNCSQVGNPLSCPRIRPESCKKGCICKEGHARNDDGYCVPVEECPPQCPENEFYSTCTQGNCSPENCTQVGFPIACPFVAQEYCKKGCLCKQGFARNDKGVCIPSEQCPSCRGDKNARPGCGGYCNQRCSDIGKEPRACTLICEINGCDCKPGFYYDSNKDRCVKPEQCSPQCPKNEIYCTCTQGSCSPQNCTQIGFPIACPAVNKRDCKKGCLCKEGYARNHKGVCVPTYECPSCRGDSNARPGCGGYCNQRCSDIGKEPRACTLMCEINSCDCKPGFYFDDKKNRCVKPEHCSLSKPSCGKNEKYNNCTNAIFGAQTCKELGFPLSYTDVRPENCLKGCSCISGYVRNDNGVCIPIDYCPSCGGDPNAKSGCGGNCNKHCYNLGKKPGVCALACILNGCDCKDGYYFDDFRKLCVLPQDCTRQCPSNEVFSDCINGGCSARNCTQYGKPVPCVKIDPRYCIAGCVCKEHYLRDCNGKCVLAKNCPEACNGPNEEYSSCSWNCPPQTCDSLGRAYKCPVQTTDNCQPACRCKQGFYRNKHGQCVTEQQCYGSSTTIAPICGRDEVYEDCKNPVCRAKYCKELGFPLDCLSRCKAGCVCKHGYVRDGRGNCIPEQYCPSCGGDKNAVSGCGQNCGRHCSDIGKGPVACKAICKFNSCDCKEGFYYCDKAQRCVRKEECGVVPTRCPVNERYESCPGTTCEPEYCNQLGFQFPCPEQNGNVTCSKKPRCVCIEGYVRDKNGRCIPKNACPFCGGDAYARSGCGVNCGKTCRELGKGPRPCIKICYVNACDCLDGYYFDAHQKKCVLPGQCTDICDKNEIFEDCINPHCKAETCSELGFPLDCKKTCKKGCICQNGFVRDSTGACVPAAQCPRQCPSNEVFSDCINGGCSARNCTQYGKPVPCVKIDPRYCIAGCVCKEHYLRDCNGKCVLAKNCPEACNGPNEEYSSCSWNCPPQTCDSLGRAYKCPVQTTDNCQPACRCKQGFYRNKHGQCVTEQQCYGSSTTIAPICGRDEVYEDCKNPVCRAKYCKELGFPLDCLSRCKTGCVCKHGYVRDGRGNCIPEQYCPSCGGDKNAVAGCGQNCGRHCSDIGKGPVACKAICKFNSCDCKEGFYYCDKAQRCVRKEECGVVPTRCPVNERYESCPGTTCEPEYCNQLGFQFPCPEQNGNVTCSKKPGCVCIEGYLRDNNGRCIPKNACPSCGGDAYARSGCGVNCGKTCRELGKGPRPCIKICYVNACDCLDGYYFDAHQKKCVLPGQCTDICDKNEIFEDCINPHCKAETCSELGFPLDCKKTCKKGCICQNGFVRDSTGACVPAAQCPSCGGDKNAQLGCGTNCNKRCPNSQINPRLCPRIACVPQLNKCECRDGFLYDVTQKKCVERVQCTPRCNDQNNEVPDVCINGGCGWRNCSQLGQPMLCVDPVECELGCACKKGYYRLDNGTCVPESQCPITSCGGDKNAQKGCGFNCGKRCPNNYINPKFCPRIQCQPDKCDCKDGFYYDINTQSCVTLGECSPRCNEQNNEVYDPCVNGGCGWRNCSQVGRPILCIDPITCNKGCKCKDGYYRLDDGTCVPESQCPNKQCKGPNEHFNCGSACDNECSHPEYKIDCPIKNIRCNPKCYCNEGFARNESGICIPECDCPKQCKGPNEHFNCGSACDNECSHPEYKIDCPIKNIRCNPKCYCNEGFARNESGICIPECDCPIKCKGVNEHYECGPPCDNVCGKKESKNNCPHQNIKCNPKCYCNDGFARNPQGVCVPLNQCPKQCKGPNEHFNCGSACDNECSHPEYKIDCPIKNIKCNPKCYCNEGFARNESGICIPECDCPTPRCNEQNHEVYDPCVNGGCGWRNCSQVGGPKVCIDPVTCKKGCKCKDGYYRLDDGTCVPERHCPNKQCKGPNEHFNCGSACDNECSHPEYKIDCPIKNIRCNPKCYCNEGFARNESGICIPECDCPIKCKGVNEHYECGPPCDNVCGKKESKNNCPHQNVKCNPKCYCNDGFARNPQGVCVPVNQCPKTCRGPNEYHDCGPECDNVCGKKENKYNCPYVNIQCVSKCYCKDGFARNKHGICVPYNQCHRDYFRT